MRISQIVAPQIVTGSEAVVQQAEEANFSETLTPAQRSALLALVPPRGVGLVNAAFAVAPKYGVNPWLLVGILRVESNFGEALTTSAPGAFNGQTVRTGDFIPRPAEAQSPKFEKKVALFNAFMEQYPLPGCRKAYWERKKVGNLPAFKGLMWVPAYDLKVAAFGPQAYKESSVRSIAGGIGWGFTPWQLDWGRFGPKLLAGAAWNPRLATEAALELIKYNIDYGRSRGFTGAALLAGSIAAYNAGEKVFDKMKQGTPVSKLTAHKEYTTLVAKVASVAQQAGDQFTV